MHDNGEDGNVDPLIGLKQRNEEDDVLFKIEDDLKDQKLKQD